MILSLIFLLLGMAAVVKAADWFLDSAEKIGLYFGLPAFVLGVLLVGFGTSLPEAATSVSAVIGGQNNIAIANVVGSNLANILLILGLSTIVMGTIKFQKDLINLDLPLLFGVTTLFALLLVDGTLSRFDGIFLGVAFVGYIFYTIFHSEAPEYHKGLVRYVQTVFRGKNPATKSMNGKNVVITKTDWLLLIGSVILLAMASRLSVDALLDIVTRLEWRVEVLTFFTLAIGTSLPELLVSFKAIRRGQGDLVLGNIIGSCMFNILLVAGLSSLIADQSLSPGLVYISIAGLGVSVLFLVLSSFTRRIHMWEGLLFLLIYITIGSQLIQAGT